MPCGHGRTINCVEKSVDRTSRIMLKRSLGQNTNRFCWKDHQVPNLGSNNSNSEQRSVVFTVFVFDLDVYQKQAPLLPPLQGAHHRNQLTSGGAQDMNGLESLHPQLTTIFQVDLENEQNLPMLERTNSAKLFTYCNSFRGNVLGQTQNGKKWVESLNSSSSTFLPCYLVSDKSPTSVCNDRAVDSDFLADGFPKTGKTAKQSARKKGKKKGKQYRRTARQKDFAAFPCEENINGSPPYDMPYNSGLTCSQDHAADQPSENTPSSSSIRESTREKDDSENNNEYVDCSTPLISCTSSSDAVDDSEPIDSPQLTVSEDISCSSYLNNGSSSTEVSEVIPSDCSENIGDVQPMQKNHQHYPSNSLDNSNPAVADAFLDGWNSDVSGNFSDDVDMSSNIKSESGGNLEESYQMAAANSCGAYTDEIDNCYLGNPYWSKDVTDNRDSIERTQCSSEACSSNDFHPVISGRRGRRARNRTIHSGIGKDNALSFWQKVQKLDRDDCICKPRNVSAVSHAKVPSTESKTKMRSELMARSKRSQSEKAPEHPCSDETINRDRSRGPNGAVNMGEVSSTVADRTHITVANTKLSKQAIHQPKKGYYAAKNNMTEASRNHIQKNEEYPKCELIQTCSVFSQQTLLKQSQGAAHNQSVGKQKLEADIEAMTQGTYCLGCDVHTQMACSEAGVIDQQGSSNKPDGLFLAGVEDNDRIKFKTGNSLLEHNKLNSSTGVVQKWVPIGRRDKAVSDVFPLESSKASSVERFTTSNHSFDKNAPEPLSSDIPDALPSTGDVPKPQNGVSPCLGDDTLNNKGEVQPHSSDVLEDEPNIKVMGKSHSHSIQHFGGELVSTLKADDLKYHHFVNPENDLDNIRKAVSDSYKVQITVEGIQLANGTMLADCERFVYCASPVICNIPFIKSCNYCPRHVLGDRSLCRHQTPNIALKRIWQWYEEPGCYGLEVKAKDFRNSRRLWNNHSEFNAYFVPYLSAVQLFGRSKKTRHDNCNEEPAIFVNRSKSSNALHSSPIFSMLLPQTHIQREKHLVESSCFNTDDQSSDDDGKLIFEYFESEQPPWRRSLFEKIKELVNVGKSSNSQIYGDPQNLEHLNLLDLHPASWYSVAWYPIYRIPDGNFHAAFLTYHSLGHLVHQSLDAAGPKRIVSPVVGLQTYNDKGEWWFQMRDPDSQIGSSAEASYSDSLEILQERLRTLNQAAAAMARAKVHKNGQPSRNLHPDFEFFQSRYR